MTMDFKSGYIAILMVYVTFGGFTRNLVHGGNESTSTEGISDPTSTKLVQLTTLLGTVQVNISSTTMSSLGTSVSSDASSSLGTSVSSTTLTSLGTSNSSDASSSLGTSVSSDASSSLGTSVASTTLTSLGTSNSSDASSSLGTLVSSDASSSLGTSVASTTLTSLGTSNSSDASSSLGTSVSSDASSSLGTSVSSTTMSSLETSVSSDASSFLGTSVSSTTLSALGTSISGTTLNDIGTSISMTTELSSTTTASGVLFADTAPVNISSTTLSTGTSTSLATNTSTTVSGAVQLTDTAPVNISSTKFIAEPNTTLKASGTSISSTTLSTIGTSTSLETESSSTATTLEADLHTESLTAPRIGCQDWNTSCMNNGNCTPEGTCLCPPSWTGRQCEYPCFPDGCPSEINVCIIDRKCNLNGTFYCSNMTDCFCFPGWNSSLCNISVCDNYYCYNGGKCRNVSGVAVCDCVGDATGSHCEHNGNFSCYDMPSSARDHIISCIDNIGYYTLVCKPEWTGKNCETPIDITEFCSSNECGPQSMEYCNAECKRGNCSQIEEDMHAEETETYPTGGCTFTIRNPWNMCNTSNCSESFANGFCDSSCNNEDCLYDGYDCIDGKGFLEDCSPYFNTPCSYNLTFDGKCNPECNTTDCLYDGFDCALSELSPLPGQLVIQVMQNHSHMDNIVRKIGLLLRSGINKTFSDWMYENTVVIAYLQLTCSELVNKKCFTSIQSAAKFLAAYVAKLTVPDLLVTDIFACEDGYYDNEGCQSQCNHGCKNSTSREICYKYSGNCIDGCRDEFYGIKCDTECSDNCGEGVGRRCNMDNGNCIYPCKKDYYGPQCNYICSNECLTSCDQDGTCIGGCQGNLSYGLSCEEKCPRLCQNSTCDHLGKCHACVIGYHGDNCAKPCPKGCIEGCSQTTGDCFKCKTHHHGNKCEADASYGQHEERDPVKTDYTGVIVGVVASVFIIAVAILIAFLCWRRQQSGDYVLDEEAGTKTNANVEAVTSVQDQNSHMANFASSKDAVDLDDMHDNSVYTGRPQSTEDDELTENSPETPLGINNQFQPFVEITLTADLDESNEKFLNSDSVDWKLSPQDYAAETRDTDDQSSDDKEGVAVRTSGLLVAGGAPLAASEASLLSKDTLGEAPQSNNEPSQSDNEPPQSDNEPPQSDNQFMFEDGNLPQVTEADFNEGNISDEEEEEKETQKSRSSRSSSSYPSDNN